MTRLKNIDIKYFVSSHIHHNVHKHYVSSRLVRFKLTYDMYGVSQQKRKI